MIQTLLLAFLLSVSPQLQTAVKPLNTVGVATGCTSPTTCVYTDVAVPAGPHFYFVVASNALGYSGPSNRVDVTVPTGAHNVTLTWVPGNTDPTATYWIYRGAPATNLGVTGSQ